MPRPTLADVARRAFVSLSTASAALSGRPGVSAQTRELVERSAEELGYRPSGLARGMRAPQRPIVGILIDPALQEGRADSAQVFVRGLLHGLFQEILVSGALPMMLGQDAAGAPVDALLIIDVGPSAAVPAWRNARTPVVVAGVPPLQVAARVQLSHPIPQIIDQVMTTLGPTPGSDVALLLPRGRMRHLEAFAGAYLHWCVSHARRPVVQRFEPTMAQAQRAGEHAVRSGAAGVFLPSGRCEWSVLTGIAAEAGRAGREVPVVALGEGVVESAFGPTVGYLSLEGAASARLIATTVLAAIAGTVLPAQIDLPWRLAAPDRTATGSPVS